MVVLETRRGPFRLIEVYYPEPIQVNRNVKHFPLNQIVYLRQVPVPLGTVDPPVSGSHSGNNSD